MKAESIEILERHKGHWNTLRDAGYVAHLDNPTKKEIESVIREEVQPGYYENLWCGECVTSMIRRIYLYYENHLKEQALRAAGNTIAQAAAGLIQDPASPPKPSRGKKAPKK